MNVIIWEFDVPETHRQAFEQAYGAHGDWARLFDKGDGYLGTELMRDQVDPARYVTIDKWQSSGAFDRFLADWREAYLGLDKRCAGLTTMERRIGAFCLVPKQEK